MEELALKAMTSLIGKEILAPQSLSLCLVLSQRMHIHMALVDCGGGGVQDTCIYLSLQLP